MKKKQYITPEYEAISLDTSFPILSGSSLEVGFSDEDATEDAYSRREFLYYLMFFD